MGVAAVTMTAVGVASVSTRFGCRLAMRVAAVAAVAVAMTVRVGVVRRGHFGMKAQLGRLAKATARFRGSQGFGAGRLLVNRVPRAPRVGVSRV